MINLSRMTLAFRANGRLAAHDACFSYRRQTWPRMALAFRTNGRLAAHDTRFSCKRQTCRAWRLLFVQMADLPRMTLAFRTNGRLAAQKFDFSRKAVIIAITRIVLNIVLTKTNRLWSSFLY